ncbi:MAG: Do family serine endopeptidase [Immundisolibacteraceae bacterium]|nr:Do family serine endopeptidase [Immundisolibacteraceae bacterium]
MNRSNLLRFFLQAATAGLIAGLVVLALQDNFSFGNANDTDRRRASFSSAVQASAPSVVNIFSSKTIKRQRHPLLDNPMFQQFFGAPRAPRERIQSSLGSGVLINNKGLVLTNNHVIDGADEIKVALSDGRSALAQLVGSDPDTDLAVLRIDLPELSGLVFGDSDGLLVGDLVLAIGNPFGVGQTVTMGIVSATGRKHLGINTFEDFIQTDAAINPGNSGGALINISGELVGINTAIYSQSGGSQGIGFAVPAELAKRIVEQLITNGRVIRGWLGLDLQDVDHDLAKSFGLPDLQGVIVAGVYRRAPAYQAGLKAGDILTAINGTEIDGTRKALNTIAALQPNKNVMLTYLRQGKQRQMSVGVMERPASTTPRRRR